jgi:dTDP-6-deoxy-L-talose 4-dehydrogenase (NAD+)
MKIFLTGQEGFIGREILRQARQAGHEVLGLEKPFRMANPPWEEIAAFAPDICIHSAWIATPGEYTTSPLNTLHRRWSVDLIKGLAKSGVAHFVVMGTCAEYAASVAPLNEEGSPLNPPSLYAREKAALHHDLIKLEKELGFTLSWARIFYPYGPEEHPQRLISSLVRGWKTGNPLHLINPESVRDYIHVEDVATALLVIAEQRIAGAVNVGTGTGVRLGEMDSLIRERMGIPHEVVFSPMESSGLNDSVVADSKKLKSLGWKPRYDIKSGINSFFKIDNRESNQFPHPVR